MAARKSAWAPNLLTALFTTLVAPVLVSVVVRNLETEAVNAGPSRGPSWQLVPGSPERPAQLAPNSARSAERVSFYPPPAAVTVTEEVLAKGEGATANEALRNALREAVRQALLIRLDANVSPGGVEALVESVLRDGVTVLRWEERSADTGTQWVRKGHRKEVIATLDSAALDGRVRTARLERVSAPAR